MKFFSRTSSPLSLDPQSRGPSPLRTDSNLSHLSNPPRRPRLRHGAPPFFAGWAAVKSAHRAKRELRFCTLAGPTLRYSASPTQDILAASVLVYGAAISAEEFPTLKIVVRAVNGAKVVLYPESRAEYAEWVRELVRASRRCLMEVYRFERDLRSGGLGRTSLAVERETADVVSVKVTVKEGLSNKLVALARKEPIVLLSMPEHDNCVVIVDMYESARTIYLVTEYEDGAVPLHQWVKGRGFVSEMDVAAIIKDLLSALTHLHASGVAHRMVSPQNVLIRMGGSRRRSVRLCNFEFALSSVDTDGAACLLQYLGNDGPLQLNDAMYLAPEVAAGRIGDYAQDVWSAGIVMHDLLVGCTPFEGESLQGVLRSASKTKGLPIFSGPLWRGISSGAKHLCASMLHADPRERVKAAHALEHPWLSL